MTDFTKTDSNKSQQEQYYSSSSLPLNINDEKQLLNIKLDSQENNNSNQAIQQANEEMKPLDQSLFKVSSLDQQLSLSEKQVMNSMSECPLEQPNLDPQTIEDESQIKELLFGGGGGGICFFEGYLQALIEIVGKEKLRKFKMGGVSCGTAAAGYFYIAVHSDLDMKYFFHNYSRRYFEKGNKKYFGLFTSGQLIFQDSLEFYQLVQDLKLPNINGNYHLSLSVRDGIFSFKKVIVDHFENAEDFASAVLSSSNIPMFTTFGIFTTFRGMQAMDGGLKAPIPYKYKNSRKIFINILPKFTRMWPFTRDIPKHCDYLDISETYNLKFPVDYYLWSEEWADEMFYKGYLSGMDNREKIKNIFDKF